MATLYYNAAVDTDWNTLGNWWTDSGHTTEAAALPTSADSVVLSATCDTNSGSTPTVVNLNFINPDGQLNIEIETTGVATILDGINLGTIYSSSGLSVVFNGGGVNLGTINGPATFNGSGGNESNGTILGPAIFNTGTHNYGTVASGSNADFYGTAVNSYSGALGLVTGNATFHASSYNLPPADIVGGVNGSILFSSLTSVAFSTASWNVDASSWNFTTPSPTFQGGSIESGAVFPGNATIDAGYYSDGSILGNATFNDSFNNGSVSGNATFNGSVHNMGLVSGNATYNTGSRVANGSVGIDAIFNGNSYTESGTVTGNATFNGTSYISGPGYAYINGNATFNDNSYIANGPAMPINGNATFRGNSKNYRGINGSVILAYEKGINGSSILGVV